MVQVPGTCTIWRDPPRTLISLCATRPPMRGLPPSLRKSFRASRIRARVFRALVRMRRAYPDELARSARTNTKVLRWVMWGHPPRYRRERALIRLGVAREVVGIDGTEYEITIEGERLAGRG